MPVMEDLTGRKYGRLTVVGVAGTDRGRNRQWRCLCECGGKTITLGFRLKNGHTQSCGCLRQEKAGEMFTTRGEVRSNHRTRLYRIWSGMKNRCLNPNNPEYCDYGGRGISVCEEWKNDFLSFKSWALSTGYDDSLSIDRMNVNGNYEPSNCRWETARAQTNNRRNTRFITFEGDTRPLTEWSDRTGISSATLKYRLNNGWSVRDALTTPCREVAV